MVVNESQALRGERRREMCAIHFQTGLVNGVMSADDRVSLAIAIEKVMGDPCPDNNDIGESFLIMTASRSPMKTPVHVYWVNEKHGPKFYFHKSHKLPSSPTFAADETKRCDVLVGSTILNMLFGKDD
jgi:hypothetical protein